jgi:hypothetical protein
VAWFERPVMVKPTSACATLNAESVIARSELAVPIATANGRAAGIGYRLAVAFQAVDLSHENPTRVRKTSFAVRGRGPAQS